MEQEDFKLNLLSKEQRNEIALIIGHYWQQVAAKLNWDSSKITNDLHNGYTPNDCANKLIELLQKEDKTTDVLIDAVGETRYFFLLKEVVKSLKRTGLGKKSNFQEKIGSISSIPPTLLNSNNNNNNNDSKPYTYVSGSILSVNQKLQQETSTYYNSINLSKSSLTLSDVNLGQLDEIAQMIAEKWTNVCAKLGIPEYEVTNYLPRGYTRLDCSRELIKTLSQRGTQTEKFFYAIEQVYGENSEFSMMIFEKLGKLKEKRYY